MVHALLPRRGAVRRHGIGEGFAKTWPKKSWDTSLYPQTLSFIPTCEGGAHPGDAKFGTAPSRNPVPLAQAAGIVGANDILALATSSDFQTAVKNGDGAKQQMLLGGVLDTIGRAMTPC